MCTNMGEDTCVASPRKCGFSNSKKYSDGSCFVNISVLNKISFDKGLTAKLPSRSAVSALPVVGSLPSPHRPSSRVWVGLRLSFDLTVAASCLSLALALLVFIREINNMAGTWNLAAYEIPQAGAAHPKVLCS